MNMDLRTKIKWTKQAVKQELTPQKSQKKQKMPETIFELVSEQLMYKINKQNREISSRHIRDRGVGWGDRSSWRPDIMLMNMYCNTAYEGATPLLATFRKKQLGGVPLTYGVLGGVKGLSAMQTP